MANQVKHNLSEVIARIQNRTKELSPDSPKLEEALLRIGLYVSAVAKINVRKRGLIDTGRLINSIRYEVFQEGETAGVRVGSWGVPYAKTHEFGFSGKQSISSHQRLITKAWGRSIDPRSVTISAHSRQINIKARPYLRPALTSSRIFIIDTLRAALGFINK